MQNKKLKMPKNVSVTYTSPSKRGRPLKDRTGEDAKCQLGVKVSKDSWERLKKIADYKGVSASDIINSMINDYIKKNEKGLLQVEAAIKSAFKK